MALVSKFGKLLLKSHLAQNAKNLTKVTEKAHATGLFQFKKAAGNAERLVREVSPEEVSNVQKSLNVFETFGTSKGETKYLTDIMGKEFNTVIKVLTDDKLVEAMIRRKDLLQKGILARITPENKKLFTKLLNDKNITDEQLVNISGIVTEENLPLVKKLLKDKNFDSKILADIPSTHLNPHNVETIKQIAKRGDVGTQEMLYIMSLTDKNNAEVATKLLQKAEKGSTKGLHCFLNKLRGISSGSKETVELLELRKKTLLELLDTPNFRLGKTEMENFELSQVLSEITPENCQIAKRALLEGKVKASELRTFISGITQENKKLAEDILEIATSETKLPKIKHLDVESATKYIDEVKKIGDKKAQKHYLEVMEDLDNPKNIDKIVELIRKSGSANAKETSAIISCLGRGLDNVEEIRAIVQMIEKSGRNLENAAITNLAVITEKSNSPTASMLKSLLDNKSVSDSMLETHLCDYITKTEKLTKENIDSLPIIMKDLYKNKNLNPTEIRDIFNTVSDKNIKFVKKYATKPEAKKIDFRAIKSNTTEKELESVLEANIPKAYQQAVLPYIKEGEIVSCKRLEFAQKLLQKNGITPSDIENILAEIDGNTIKYIDDILKRSDLSKDEISKFLKFIKEGKGDELTQLLHDSTLNGEAISSIIQENIFLLYKHKPEIVKKALELKAPVTEIVNGNFVPVTDILGDIKYKKMLDEIEQVNAKLGIKASKNLFLETGGANDLFILLTDGHIGYKFNRKTGKLVSFVEGNKTTNLKTHTVVQDIVAQEPIFDIFASTQPKAPYFIQGVQQSKKGKFEVIYSESEVAGQYDIFRIKPDGSRVKIGAAQYSPNGAKHVRRTLTSLDGGQNYLAYREDKTGNSYLHSVIRDSAGKQISEVKRTFKVLSKNHFVSTYNGQSYDIIFRNDKVVVTKLNSAGEKTKEAVEFAIKDIPASTADEILDKLRPLKESEIHKVSEIMKQYGIEPRTIDRSCVDMLKRLPGDEWFAMSKSAEFVLPQSLIPNNAFYAGNSIFMSKELKGNLGVFSHELGHAKVHALNLTKDKELIKIYNEEKKAYTATFPKSRIESIDYFLSALNGRKLNGLNELGAESNTVTTTIQTHDAISDRTVFAEQYFQKTIAYLRNKYKLLI